MSKYEEFSNFLKKEYGVELQKEKHPFGDGDYAVQDIADKKEVNAFARTMGKEGRKVKTVKGPHSFKVYTQHPSWKLKKATKPEWKWPKAGEDWASASGTSPKKNEVSKKKSKVAQYQDYMKYRTRAGLEPM